VHISVADFSFQQLRAMGKDVIMKKDLELTQADIQDRDLLISLGMTHTPPAATFALPLLLLL
jgi:hypothetical protein